MHTRYSFAFAPPNRFGAVQGVFWAIFSMFLLPGLIALQTYFGSSGDNATLEMFYDAHRIPRPWRNERDRIEGRFAYFLEVFQECAILLVIRLSALVVD